MTASRVSRRDASTRGARVSVAADGSGDDAASLMEGRSGMVAVASLWRGSSSLTDTETALLEATVGLERYRILTRRPLTVALGPRAYAPGLCGAFLALILTWQNGAL